ncbi:MAG TPA: DUF6298 domain-containing protein, partial [Candidatus Binatia bacterium]|nr:DUF6298 domain-containing protein [Candidatus Binatia bacterium]
MKSALAIWLALVPLITRGLSPHPDNPHYFLFRGKPAVLITSGEHYGAVLNKDFDYVAYLDELVAHRFNHTRLFSGTYCEREDSFGITGNTLAPVPGAFVCPWARSETPGCFDGGSKFDLTRWDEKYFARLKDLVQEAGRRGIVVEMNLFCTMYSDAIWGASPMNSANNINGIGRVSRNEVYALKEEQLTAAQEAVARKIVNELNTFDNVYYEVCNEPYERSGMHPDWQSRIVQVITEAESSLPNKHLISLNDEHRDGKITKPRPLVSIYNFHAATPESVTLNYALGKALGDNETGGSARDDKTYRVQAWEFILAGGALFSHLDFSFATTHPRGTLRNHKSPGGGSPELRQQLGILKKFIEGFDFVRMTPDKSIAALPAGTRIFALSERGRQYAIYLSGARQTTLSLDLPAGSYRAEWINTLSGQTDKREDIRGGTVALTPPNYREDIALR